MANFDSPLGKKTFNATKMRTFDVPDETNYSESYQEPQELQEEQEDLNSLEKDLRKAQEARKTGKEFLTAAAKKRIDMLLGITRMTSEVNIDNTIFILRTLKSKEMREAIYNASLFEGTIHTTYELRKQLLARAITHIAGIDINEFLNSNLLEAKMIFIDEMDESLNNRLYNEYVDLVNKSNKKYAMKNIEDAKEVAEDLKK